MRLSSAGLHDDGRPSPAVTEEEEAAAVYRGIGKECTIAEGIEQLAEVILLVAEVVATEGLWVGMVVWDFWRGAAQREVETDEREAPSGKFLAHQRPMAPVLEALEAVDEHNDGSTFRTFCKTKVNGHGPIFGPVYNS
jgi:hypothetical protein